MFYSLQVAETIPSIPSAFEDAADIEELEAMYDDMTDEDFTKKVQYILFKNDQEFTQPI